MYVEKITLCGFRCFGEQPKEVLLNAQLTAVIGPNGSGKSAVLHSLMRLFGVTRAQRTIVPSDFYFTPANQGLRKKTQSLWIEVILSLPELNTGIATAETVAPIFRHMQIALPGSTPICRLRLDARWDDDGTAEGSITQELSWLTTLNTVPVDAQKSPVTAADRGLIQLYYTPAVRDSAAQIKTTTGALATRLLKAIEWSYGAAQAVQAASTSLSSAFGNEQAIQAITHALSNHWSSLHDGDLNTRPRLSILSHRFEEIIARVAVVFEEGPGGAERGIDSLSDGQQSLFYFALAAAVFDVERSAVSGQTQGFNRDDLTIPALTIFAIEEPENHLSPYYLARIISQLRAMVKDGAAQCLLTSHSPSVLSRVEPQDVRYCNRDSKLGTSVVGISLPAKQEDAAKFVRSAMLAFPELYFARFVILVEGDSERVVLPKLAEALGLMVDPSFVAIVPLGGRHVQHFWRLLKDLGIRYVTLLDLDLGREGGGYGRVKTVIQNLITLGEDRNKLLDLEDGTTLDSTAFDNMHTWAPTNIARWLDRLEKSYDVFFCWPLDLDLAMLGAFPKAYQSTIMRSGPQMSQDNAIQVVLGNNGTGADFYDGDLARFLPLMPHYRYHFLTHSKPATHMGALANLSCWEIFHRIPEPLRRLLTHINARLSGI